MKNVLFTLLLALTVCSPYHAVRPPASAYARPVRPPGWTTGVNSIEELRRYSARPTATPPGWTPDPSAPYAAPPIPSDYNAAVAGKELNRRLYEDPRAHAVLSRFEAEDQAQARQQQIDAQQEQIDALSEINY